MDFFWKKNGNLIFLQCIWRMFYRVWLIRQPFEICLVNPEKKYIEMIASTSVIQIYLVLDVIW